MSELDDLRKDVARMRRNATRKISRIKKTTGALVTGSEFDPRRGTQVQGRYTESQLSAYRDTLASFLSRQSQYVPDASKQPLPRREWVEYERQEKAYRDTAGSVYERIKGVELPSGETIAQRLAKMNVLHKQMVNPTVNTIFESQTRESGNIVSRKALAKLTRAMKKQATPGSIKRKVREAREQFASMMDVVNMPELVEATKGLTNNQFIALWNFTSFASAVALSYTAAQKMLSPKEESWAHEVLRQQMVDAVELIDWVKTIKT